MRTDRRLGAGAQGPRAPILGRVCAALGGQRSAEMGEEGDRDELREAE